MGRSHGYDDPRCEVIRARANASLTGPSGEREFHEHAFRDVELLLDILDEAQEQIDEAEHSAETANEEAESASEEASRCAAERDGLRWELDVAEAKLAALVGGLPGDAA